MRFRFAVILGIVAVVSTACGMDHADHNASGGTSSAAKTVAIEMRDTAYAPNSLRVKKGETVRFVFTNKGKVAHDAFIGNDAAQTKHEQEMSTAMAGMDHGGHDADAITVEPAKTGELTHTFDAAGTTTIGCHQQGHYAAGMRITVTVS